MQNSTAQDSSPNLRKDSVLKPDDMQSLAFEVDVAVVQPLVPRLRAILVENRHPAFGKPEVIEVADELRVRLFGLELAFELQLDRIAKSPKLNA